MLRKYIVKVSVASLAAEALNKDYEHCYFR